MKKKGTTATQKPPPLFSFLFLFFIFINCLILRVLYVNLIIKLWYLSFLKKLIDGMGVSVYKWWFNAVLW